MMLRAGLAGLGMMGRHHMRLLSQIDGVDFVGIFDPAPNPNLLTPGIPVFDSLEGLLTQKLDYCVVAAPTMFHFELGMKLAQSGVHALIEKPLATNPREAEQLVQAFADADLIGGVGHIERFNPALRAMRTKIEEGLIGEIFQISTRRQGPFPARIADVGVIKDLATHDIDLTAWVAQKPYVSVTAHTAHRSRRIHEDMVIAVGQLEGGIIVNHVVNWLSPFKERNTTVIGDKGALVADNLTGDLTYFENGHVRSNWDSVSEFRGVSEGDVIRFALNKVEPLLTEHLAFRDAVITGETRGIVTFHEGLAVVKIAEQMINH